MNGMSRAARRLRSLLARGDVALQVCGPHAGYFYRPRELVCSLEDDDQLQPIFRRFGGDRRDRWVDTAKSWRGELRTVKQPVRRESVDLSKLGLARWFMPPDIAVPGLVALIRQEISLRAPAALSPNFLMFGEQWWGGEPGDVPDPMSLEEALSLELHGVQEPSGCEHHSVTVVDTGIDRAATDHHPPLANLAFDDADVDVLNNDANDFLDEQAGHGTFIAGIIRRRAPGVGIESVRGLDTNGVTDALTISDLVTKIAEGGTSRVINLSLGGRAAGDVPGLDAALETCRRHDVVVVAAAGNAGRPDEFYPAAHKDVIGVGAVESDDPSQRAAFSNYGDWVTACAVGTKVPGLHVVGQWDPEHTEPEGSSVVLDKFARWSGTSFATPVVAAAIVEHMAANPNLSARDAAADLLASSPAGPPMLGKFIT